MVLSSCSSSTDDNDVLPIEDGQNDNPENRPPANFNLSSVENGAQDIGTFPVLSWEAAIDPDGDFVDYTIYLDKEENPKTKYKENISETTITIDESLSFSSKYYWKIIADDGRGGVTESEVFNFSTKSVNLSFKAVTNSAAFSKRTGHTTVAFDNKLWVIGGRTRANGAFTDKNDVWFSEDGENWQKATENASFSPRSALASTVFDNKIWVSGGRTGAEDFKNDVWYSSDGITWVEAISDAPFQGREDHTLTAFNDKLWIIGGWDLSNGTKNDVWSSVDGVIWLQATASAPFEKRYASGTTVFDSKLWVIAGGGSFENKNDVWYTGDGITWVEATENASFSERNGLTSTTFDDKLWVIGGYDNPNFKNDIWYTEDGIRWVEVASDAPFSPRSGHTTAVLDNKLWIIGGFDINDVWYFDKLMN